MKHLRTSFSLILVNLLILINCSANIENKNSADKYNALCNDNDKLNVKIKILENNLKSKDDHMQVLKDNAAYLLALEPVAEYFTEEELFELIEEIPKGNPFLTGFRITASFGESTGFFPRDDHGGTDLIPLHPENMEWGIYPTASGFVVSDGEDAVHGKNIIIQNTDRVRTRFSHLNKYYYRAVKGKEVTTEILIGEMGNTGYSKNAHLHYEIWIKVSENKWIKINAKPFLRRNNYV